MGQRKISALNRTQRDSSKQVQRHRRIVEGIFSTADIRINGSRPFDIKVKNEGFYRRVLTDGALGLGESYVDGWWEAERIDEVMCRFAAANVHGRAISDVRMLCTLARIQLSGIGNKSSAFEVGKHHYDLGNDLFEAMLDSRMVYSCAYWKDAKTLDQAQINKLDLVCRKLALKPGMRVLEIGFGWGGWAKFAAENYGVDVVGITVSKEQLAFAREYCAGLPIDLRLQDYRHVNERFDRIVSIGMFEHVGHNYHRTFMKVARRCLHDDGLFLLHTIVGNEPFGSAELPWITKYIFPNGEIPSLKQITAAAEKLFVVEAMHHFGSDYEMTLEAWFENFVKNWHKLDSVYDQRFFRMWSYYLLMARGLFRARLIHLWQVVFSKNGIPDQASIGERRSVDGESYDSR